MATTKQLVEALTAHGFTPPAEVLPGVAPESFEASCPTAATAGCQCDEYPFASTLQGGYTLPASTSTRRILGIHNVKGGTEWSRALRIERVLPDEVGTDPVWVYVK